MDCDVCFTRKATRKVDFDDSILNACEVCVDLGEEIK